MKKLYKPLKTVIVCLLLVSIFSCEKDATVKLPAVESKLVVNAFISPQDTIHIVQLSLSQPLYNNSNSYNYAQVANATVHLSDGSNSCTLPYNSQNNYYSITATAFPITVGSTYYLTITTPDGKNVNASTTIPSSNNTLTFTTHTINNTATNNFNNNYINAKWIDAVGTEDYYRLAFYDLSIDSTTHDSTFSLEPSDASYSDKGKDGSVFSENLYVFNTYITPSQTQGELILIHASKEYFLYHHKLFDAGNNAGNPFTEPVIMYTNINGGFGVFAGFNQYKVLVSF